LATGADVSEAVAFRSFLERRLPAAFWVWSLEFFASALWLIRQLTKPGDKASSRYFFAKNRDNECYRECFTNNAYLRRYSAAF
jgi:hypothetical protein